MGHSGTVGFVDWSLPVMLPGTPYDGKFILQSNDTAGDLLYWDPLTGERPRWWRTRAAATRLQRPGGVSTPPADDGRMARHTHTRHTHTPYTHATPRHAYRPAAAAIAPLRAHFVCLSLG
jgi:hypothetical protein